MKPFVIFCSSVLLCMNYAYAQNTVGIADTRTTGTTPDSYNRTLGLNFKRTDTLQIPGVSPSFVVLMGMRPWGDNSGGKSHELAFASNNQIYARSGLSPAWEGWRRLLIENENGSVGIGTNAPAYNLDVVGTANANTLSINKRLILAMPATSTDRGAFNPIWMGLRGGKNLFMDEEFATGTNTIRLYTNVSDGTITVTRVAGTGVPNASGYYLEVKTTGATGTNFGGIRQDFSGKLNGTFVHLFRAKVPVGYTLNAATNSLGTGGTRHWLTSNEGTGKWEDYAYVLQFGNGGSVSTGGYVFITGSAPAASVTWQLASATIFDATALEDGANFLKNQETEDQAASFRINGNGFLAGNVGIGVTDTKGYKLAVGGNMIAEKIKVKVKTAWPDYVFAPEYKLPSLQEVAAYIKQHQHLPDMPSAKEVAAEGIDLGEMNRKLLQKVEELTLYMIGQQEEMAKQQQQIMELKKMIKALQ